MMIFFGFNFFVTECQCTETFSRVFSMYVILLESCLQIDTLNSS